MNTKFVSIILSVSALHAQESPTYRVSGRVVDSISGKSLSRVRISISPFDNRAQLTSQLTHDDGRFVFDKLPADRYHLTADRNGSAQQVYGQWLGAGFGTSIIVGPDQSTEDLTFRFSPPAVIAGRVLDDAGEPVRNALVQLLTARILGGRRRVVSQEWTWTKDLGEYRFSQLRAGSYYIVVTARPWWDGYPIVQTSKLNAYAPAFYPNGKGTASDEAIQLKAGEEALADIRLAPVNGRNINVTFGQDRTGEIRLMFHSILGNDSFQATEEASNGFHTFTGVPPGRYTIWATWNDKSSAASISPEFEVNENDVSIDLNSSITATLKGSVKVDGDGAKNVAGGLVSFVDEESNRGFSLEVAPTGSFTSDLVPPGRYRVRFSGVNDVSIKAVTGDKVSEDGIVTTGASDHTTIQLVLTSEVGRVKGHVFLGNGPVAGALVVLAPEQPGNSGLYRSFQTDSDGSFDLRAIPSGHYRLFAAEDGSSLEYANPIAIRPFMEFAKRLNIAGKSVITERINLPRKQ